MEIYFKDSLNMESLITLESFTRSAELGSFSAAARHLRVTPAAVSRNVAALERNLGVQLFHRSTRKLSLTEAGEHLMTTMSGALGTVQASLADVAGLGKEPMGILRVSMSLTFGIRYVMPILGAFKKEYPKVLLDLHLDNRQVALVAESYDLAIGGGFPLSPATITRPLAPAHIIAVASPAYLAGRSTPQMPADLAALDGIIMRSANTGRLLHWMMRDSHGNQMAAVLNETIILNDPAAMAEAATQSMGVAMLTVSDVIDDLESGRLIRLIPEYYADAGSISLYYAQSTHQPAKVRAFVNFLIDRFRALQLSVRFSAHADGLSRYTPGNIALNAASLGASQRRI